MTCHASIVSRELGIPCIVGTKSRSVEATTTIQDGAEITVDATNGIVYEGIVADIVKPEAAEAPASQAATTVVAAEAAPITGTKIYMNLGNPDLAEKYGKLPCDGIGLMREEFIWTTFIHEHPLYLIETGRADYVVDQLSEGIRKVCQALAPRPVTLRLSDFKSSEYRNLTGGDKYEPQESSALLGWRGASRYYDPKYVEAFKLELKAVRKVREEYGFKNLNVMIPFCRRVDEMQKSSTSWLRKASIAVRTSKYGSWLKSRPTSSWLTKRFKMKTLFIAAWAFFTIGTLLGLWSPSFSVLIIGRILQGISGGITIR